MAKENLEETEFNEEEEEAPDPEEEEGTDGEEGDEYGIDVEQALSQDIRGNKQSSPEKIDKAIRLGFDLPVDPSMQTTKPAVSI
jgi:hypothetical protein